MISATRSGFRGPGRGPFGLGGGFGRSGFGRSGFGRSLRFGFRFGRGLSLGCFGSARGFSPRSARPAAALRRARSAAQERV